MRIRISLILSIMVLLVSSGCVQQGQIYKNEEHGFSTNIPEEWKTYEGPIDCASFNSKPELRYYKSGNTLGYYVHISARKFNHSTLEIGREQKRSEEERLSKNESLGGAYCSFKAGIGKNINYVYCKDGIFSFREVSENGTITSLGFIRVKTVFSVNRTKDRFDTYGGYYPVEDAKLILHECVVTANVTLS